ncbi:MAG: ABC transporter permease [Myxococcota bacterium]
MIPDRLSWSVAWRSLLNARRLTILTLVVVSVSVILVIFLTSLIDGLEVQLVEETTGAIPHITIEPREREPVALWERDGDDKQRYIGQVTSFSNQKKKISDWRRWVDRAEAFDDDILAASPTADGRGFAIRGEREEAVRIYGVQPRRFDRIVPIQQNLLEGRFYRLTSGEVALGYSLADQMGIGLGDRIQVTTPDGRGISKRVAGIFETGFGAIDQSTVFMTLGDGQSLFGLGSAVNSIGLEVRDVFESERIAGQLALQVPYKVTDWTENNQRLLRALEGQQRSSDLIIFFTAVAAAFAIASILIVLVTNKLPEIGILKAMGATRRQIRTIFALQGSILAGFGGLLGTGLGVLLVRALSNLKGPATATGRREPIFPFELSTELIITTIVMAALLGFLASIVPARRASSVDPIEVIHGG